MAILPPPPTPTRSAIYAAYEANRDDGFEEAWHPFGARSLFPINAVAKKNGKSRPLAETPREVMAAAPRRPAN